jgi:hypothetical protein
MDIQSLALNELFVLYPVMIPGWVTPVQPTDIAHGGIPKSLYDDQTKGLECLIDPWAEPLKAATAVDDRVDLYINDGPTAVDGKTISPGEEGQRIRLYVPHGWLKDGVNKIHYKVTRPGGGSPEDSRILEVLYHLRAPGEPAPGGMLLLIPADVKERGVDAERAAFGVVFGFDYIYRRDHDRIRLTLGVVAVDLEVRPGDPKPKTHTLFTDTFKQSGDNPNTPVEFSVTDQLGNFNRSATELIDVHVERVTPKAPTIKEVETDGITLNPIKAKDTLTVVVPHYTGMLGSDLISVIWTGAAGTPIGGSHATPPVPVGTVGIKEIALPNSVVAFNFGKRVTVTYVITPDLGEPQQSDPLGVNVQTLPQIALNKPRLKQATNDGDGPELNLADLTAAGQMWFDDWPFIALGQFVWLTLTGTLSNGDAPYERQFWAAPDAHTNEDWIAKGYFEVTAPYEDLKLLKVGSPFTMKFKVGFDGSTDESKAVSFSAQTYTVTSARLDIVGQRSQIAPHYHSNRSRLVASASTTGDILWTYSGDTEGVSGETFLDEQPERSLIVTVQHEEKTLCRRVLRPSNVTGVFNLIGRHSGCITKDDGSVFGWSDNPEMLPPTGLMDVRCVTAGGQAFAALKKDSTVVAWGAPSHGGAISPSVETQLSNVKKLAATAGAFLALRDDGSLVAWGNPDFGGVIPAPIDSQLTPASQIIGNTADFSVLLRDGRVVSWGGTWPNGLSVSGARDATLLCATDRAFCALKANRGIFAWGSAAHGGSIPDSLVTSLTSVTFLASTSAAFVALKADGSVIAWGNQRFGGEAPSGLQAVRHVVGSTTAFCALTGAGSLIAWGDPAEGGKVPSGLGRALSLAASYGSFCAVLDSHVAVSWGVNTSSPTLAPVACAYPAGPHMVLLSANNTVLAVGPNAPDLEELTGKVSYTE